MSRRRRDGDANAESLQAIDRLSNPADQRPSKTQVKRIIEHDVLFCNETRVKEEARPRIVVSKTRTECFYFLNFCEGCRPSETESTVTPSGNRSKRMNLQLISTLTFK